MTKSSPILSLQNAIAASAFRIAPEREESLAAWRDLENFTLALSEERDFHIRVNMKSHVATFPVGALEFLWASAHAFFVFHQEYVAAQAVGANVLDFGGTPRIKGASELLWWSIRNMHSPGSETWPVTLPRPEQYPTSGTDGHVANELFLCAVAWIIHHEIAHVALQHGQGHPALRIKQEREADLRATTWILERCTGSAERKKRILGMATAILAMHLLDSRDDDAYVCTHPPTVERLDYCLDTAGVQDNGVECAFCAVVMHFNLARHGFQGPLDGDSIRDVLRNQIIAYITQHRQRFGR